MTGPANPTTIATIGHSNLPIEELVAMLRRHEIATVVDVRSTPYSQYTPQFNRDTLERSLAGSGLSYLFAGDYLGGRPTDPTCYHAGVVPEGDANYLALVDYDEVAKRAWYRRGIDRLVEVAGEQRTAMMCSEEDPARCHRHHLIAQSLLALGIEVQHLRKGGSVESAPRLARQLSLLP